MIGLIPFTTPVFAIIIVTLMYFGIKIYVEKRKQSIQNDVGDGICMECGSKILDKKCPNCDDLKK
jgi:rubrerythrin